MKDGIDHINIYSKGKTELGRMLSNFYYSPFLLKEHGPFYSVEAYWYWLGCRNEELRYLYGYQAKKKGQEQEKTYHVEGFNDHIKKAIRAKLQQNPRIKTALKQSSLPLKHYYVYGDKIVEPKEYNWIPEYFEQLREKFEP